MQQKITRFLRNFIILYLILAGVVYFYQRNLLYLPSGNLLPVSSYNISDSIEDITLTTSDGLQITAWHNQPASDQDYIIFFHGNAGNLSGRIGKYKDIINAGYGLLAPSYRGFSNSQGTPTEQGLYADARAAIDFLINQGISPKNIILYGESLGTGVATQIATEYDVKSLILESPYSSIYDVSKDIYWYLPVDIMLKDKFASIDKIAKINAPLLIIHGTPDQIVPIISGKKLFAAAIEPKKFIELQNTHHNNHNVKINLEFLTITANHKPIQEYN